MPDNIEAITEAQIFTRALVSAVDKASKAGDPIKFIASTSNVARDGMIIEPTAWDLGNYRSNPVILWSHDYTALPIGRAVVDVANDSLMCEIVFDQNDPNARLIESKYRNGFLNALSVGWRTHQMKQGQGVKDAPRVTRAELLEISCVPVPADPGALIERQARGLADLYKQLAPLNAALMDEGDNESAPGVVWEDVAAALMRLYTPGLQMPEHDRKRAYNRIAANYRRLGKTVPEYLSADELEGLDMPTLRGLFLCDEPQLMPFLFAEERAGAMLNAKNKADLTAAIDYKNRAIALVQGVIDRSMATKQDQVIPDESVTVEDVAITPKREEAPPPIVEPEPVPSWLRSIHETLTRGN